MFLHRSLSNVRLMNFQRVQVACRLWYLGFKVQGVVRFRGFRKKRTQALNKARKPENPYRPEGFGVRGLGIMETKAFQVLKERPGFSEKRGQEKTGFDPASESSESLFKGS